MNPKLSHPLFLGLVVVLLSVAGIAFIAQQPARADQTAAPWPGITLQPIASGFARPSYIANAGDGSQRLFIVEQAGSVRILPPAGSTLTAPFLDISDRVRSPNNGGDNEEGLLSIAFPPDYAASGIFYAYYTAADGNNRVARFHVTNDANLADAASEELILLLEHPGQSNHNGGQLAFGPDGYLYIGTGDGGGGGDPNGNAQNPASLLGKLLRIDVAPQNPAVGAYKAYLPCIHQSGSASTAAPEMAYRIPPDNPFVNQPGYRPEIWAMGLRNPWRFSFDRQSHNLWIGDVGQGQYEEVDFQLASSAGGENYGWNTMEGNHCYNSASCIKTDLTLPVTEYNHSLGCSISGGFVYRGGIAPTLQGIYFYADFCSGRIWGLRDDAGWQSQELLASGFNISSFGEAENGELYLADMYSGNIYQIAAKP
jgi:glucose/arabinose dehydrogenase